MEGCPLYIYKFNLKQTQREDCEKHIQNCSHRLYRGVKLKISNYFFSLLTLELFDLQPR